MASRLVPPLETLRNPCLKRPQHEATEWNELSAPQMKTENAEAVLPEPFYWGTRGTRAARNLAGATTCRRAACKVWDLRKEPCELLSELATLRLRRPIAPTRKVQEPTSWRWDFARFSEGAMPAKPSLDSFRPQTEAGVTTRWCKTHHGPSTLAATYTVKGPTPEANPFQSRCAFHFRAFARFRNWCSKSCLTQKLHLVALCLRRRADSWIGIETNAGAVREEPRNRRPG